MASRRTKRRRLLRIAKWGGLTALLLIPVTCEVTSNTAYSLRTPVGKVKLIYGAIQYDTHVTSDSFECRTEENLSTKYNGLLYWNVRGSWRAAIIPLFHGFFLLLPVVAGLFWLDRRRRHVPGICSSCGYNLTGNQSGNCPECGEVFRIS